jgi:two-component system, NtrC family, sensor kinase
MSQLPTLRRELIGAFAIVFAGALLVAVGAGLFLYTLRPPPGVAALYVTFLIVADVAIFAWFGAHMLHRRLLDPLDRIVNEVEAVSQGDLGMRLADGETKELARLSVAVQQLAQTLFADQQKLEENIRSLNETNRLLTEARDAMVRTEKMASVGRLGAGIAHEVGNPLGAILGYLSLIGRGADAKQKELVEAAERDAKRIDRIVRGLLDYARPRDAVNQPTDVNRVVAETIELVDTQGHFGRMELETDLDSESVGVMGDPYQLQQVFVNLLVNASHALADTQSPRLTVTTIRRPGNYTPEYKPQRRKEDPPGIDYSHRRRLATMARWPEGDPESDSGDVVEVIVSDNGPGLAPNIIDQVFEPFVTTKEPGKGTGLGLAVCARLIEGMGGAIRAGNNENGGAVFHVILPALPAEVM